MVHFIACYGYMLTDGISRQKTEFPTKKPSPMELYMMITVQVISIVGLQFNCMISMIAIISSIIFVKRHTRSCYSIFIKFTFKIVNL